MTEFFNFLIIFKSIHSTLYLRINDFSKIKIDIKKNNFRRMFINIKPNLITLG